MMVAEKKKPYFGLTGGWVTLLVTVCLPPSTAEIDAYYRTNPSLIVTNDPDAICRGRPQKYIDREAEEIEKSAANEGTQLVE